MTNDSINRNNISESVFSLDVVSLFTNIPLNLALDSINNRWVHIEPRTKIKKPDFLKMVDFVLSSTYFTFPTIPFTNKHLAFPWDHRYLLLLRTW